MEYQPKSAIHRILVVDDNPSIHADFRKILCPERCASRAAVSSLAEELFDTAAAERPGGRFELDSAFQGQEALAKVQAAEQAGRPFSLAFMDVRMPPGWDGIETITHIWKEHPQIQVVVCSAYADYSWDQIVQKLGETDSMVILKKPFDNVEVQQLAHTLTKKWAVTRLANARMADLDEAVRQRTRELLDANHTLQNEIQNRSAMESALRESEERFHRAFETVAVPLVIRTLDTGRYQDVNQSFVELCGYDKADLLGKTPEELDLFVDSASHLEHIQSLRTGKQLREVELAIRRQDGQIRQTLVSISMLRLREQSCLIAALQDVTEQKKLESQLRQSQKLEAIGQLAAGIAHEINTPTQYVGDNTHFVKDSFAAILAVLQNHQNLLAVAKTGMVTPELIARSEALLVESDLDYLCEQIPAALKQTLEGVARVSKIVRAMKEFSHPGGKDKAPADLNRAIESTVTVAHNEWKYVADVKLELAPDLPPVPCFVGEFNQCILNLVVNAAHAIGEVVKQQPGTKGLITVQTRSLGDHVEVRVADTGPGIPEAFRSKIFEPFFTTKDVGKGTGQGLSIIYGSIVRRHGGTVTFETETGRGTTFIIQLPLNHPAAPAGPSPPPESLAL
jgi:PAS domain S-box-containing protein